MRAVARALALTLLVILASSRAVVFASPPDPTWLPGIYDGADGDWVVARTIDRVGSIAVLPMVAPPVPLPEAPALSATTAYECRKALTTARGPPRRALLATCRAPPGFPRPSRRPTTTHAPAPCSRGWRPAAHPFPWRLLCIAGLGSWRWWRW
jgi:hypothetical protein